MEFVFIYLFFFFYDSLFRFFILEKGPNTTLHNSFENGSTTTFNTLPLICWLAASRNTLRILVFCKPFLLFNRTHTCRLFFYCLSMITTCFYFFMWRRRNNFKVQKKNNFIEKKKFGHT